MTVGYFMHCKMPMVFHTIHPRLISAKRSPEVVGMDCEMVGVKTGVRKQAVARCSIVDSDGKVLYDEYIKPDELITDYRTKWSGIKPRDMENAIPFEQASNNL